MKFGLPNHHIDSLCDVLSSTPSVHEAIIYGSRARGDNRPYSDIDIALKGNNITSEELTRMYFMIDDLLLPYTIDLCVLSEIRNEKLVQNINVEGKVLYIRPQDYLRSPQMN